METCCCFRCCAPFFRIREVCRSGSRFSFQGEMQTLMGTLPYQANGTLRVIGVIFSIFLSKWDSGRDLRSIFQRTAYPAGDWISWTSRSPSAGCGEADTPEMTKNRQAECLPISMSVFPYISGANSRRMYCQVRSMAPRPARYCSVTSLHWGKRLSKSAAMSRTASQS